MLRGLGQRQRASGRQGRQQSACPSVSGVSRKQLVVHARASRYDRRKPPPPDLPSLLFDQRIVYLGMPVGNAHGEARSVSRVGLNID